uniref:hypothetical protein n=1 Tax=Rickettsia endosymbiont of Urophora cardui TaxID=3066265 RepID=UPI00313E19CC
MKKDITALFCFVDDFCKISEQWINKSFLPLIKKLELPNNISEYKPAILDKIATVFDTLCTQIE